MTQEEAELNLEKALNSISEYFDCVQIMVSWNEEAETRDLMTGSGNWYARLALAREMLIRHDSQELAKQISDYGKDEE
jgi:hypothetical protein